MKPIIIYICLVFVAWFIAFPETLPFVQQGALNRATKTFAAHTVHSVKISPPPDRENKGGSIAPYEDGFSFFKIIARDLFPVLKNLNSM